MAEFCSVREFGEMVRAGSVPAGTRVRGQFAGDVTGGDSRELQFSISTGDVARDGHTIAVSGWKLEAFQRNPVVLWGHRYDLTPIARATRIWAEGNRLKASAEFVPESIDPFAEKVYQLYRRGFLRAVSVGFIPLKWAPSQDPVRKVNYGIDITEAELLEFSAVSVPADPGALIDLSIVGKSADQLEVQRLWLELEAAY